MNRSKVGTIKALWRFPVKSMLGEERDELQIARGGVIGDRAWALRDKASKRIASAKKFPRLLSFRATYDRDPVPGDPAPVMITLPNGRQLHAEDPDASAMISAVMENQFLLEHSPRPEGERAGVDPYTVFGDIPFEKIFPGLPADRAPDYFNLPSGTFFDSASIHVIASGTLAHMNELGGGKSDFDYRRFRPNLLVDTGNDKRGFIEDQWNGGILEIDGLRIVGIRPALRCVMITLAQQNLPRDLAILRAAAQLHMASLGAFASIEGEGRVQVGDSVYLVR